MTITQTNATSTSLYPRRGRLALLALGSLLLFGGAVVAVVSPRSPKDVIFGLAGVIAGPVAIFFFARAIVCPRPMLVLSEQGITLNRWRASRPGRFFAWESIAGFRTFRMRTLPFLPGQRCVGVVPVDPGDPAFNSAKQRIDAAIAELEGLWSSRGLAVLSRLSGTPPDTGFIVSNMSRVELSAFDFGSGPAISFDCARPAAPQRVCFVLPAGENLRLLGPAR